MIVRRKHISSIILLFVVWLNTSSYAQVGVYGDMHTWKTHFAYGSVQQIADAGDLIYAMADGAIFSVDKRDGEMQYYSKLTGLKGSIIQHIAFDNKTNRLFILYDDGLIDLLSHDGIESITDLQQKQISTTKNANTVTVIDGKVYLGMKFGIVVVNLEKQEIEDSYYIGEAASEVDVLQVTTLHDSIFAISEECIYSANRSSNLADFASWNKLSLTQGEGKLMNIVSFNERLYLLKGGKVYRKTDGEWEHLFPSVTLNELCANATGLFAISDIALFPITREEELLYVPIGYPILDVCADVQSYWLAAGDKGVVSHTLQGDEQYYTPDGALVNNPYRLKIYEGKLYVVPGSRWAVQDWRPGCVMIYDGQKWTNIPHQYIDEKAGYVALDFMNIAVDPMDENHFFATSFGTGLYEFRNNELIRCYHHENSPIQTRVPGEFAYFYIRLDAGMFDNDGNYWFINTGSEVKHNIHIIKPSDLAAIENGANASWYSMNIHSNGSRVVPITPGEMFMDMRNANYKWIPSCRETTGIILLDDNGTPFKSSDDKCIFRSSFVDQNSKVLNPAAIYSMVQDRLGDIWVGTEAGLFIIPNNVDFFTSNQCSRVIISRNDGTNDGDYLLNLERINAIAVDGGNRKWIGTANSGVYLMSADGKETIEHFTEDNSPMPSNEILSIAIDHQSGRVFIGTSKGLMSYQGDATIPEVDYNNAYVYPNPVRENYVGVITIKGLVENTVVHIVDNAGNVVYKTHSNGGVATWNGKNMSGSKVASGIYTALCNSESGEQYAALKIMMLN